MLDDSFELDDFDRIALTAAHRCARGLGYATVSLLLAGAVAYEMPSKWLIATTIGLLGLFTSSARIGQFAIALLMALALLAPATIASLADAITPPV